MERRVARREPAAQGRREPVLCARGQAGGTASVAFSLLSRVKQCFLTLLLDSRGKPRPVLSASSRPWSCAGLSEQAESPPASQPCVHGPSLSPRSRRAARCRKARGTALGTPISRHRASLPLFVGQGDGCEQSKMKNGRVGMCQKEVGYAVLRPEVSSAGLCWQQELGMTGLWFQETGLERGRHSLLGASSTVGRPRCSETDHSLP